MKICVIGGGAAGMICAITAARNGADVIVVEKNEKTGKKLYITGKGRCNLTNKTDFDGYMNNIVTNKKFMYSALSNFDCDKCMDFFEKLGLPLKVERGNRVFPESDKSSDVIKTLNSEIKRLGITIYLNESVEKINKVQNKIISVITSSELEITADKFVIATGGISYPLTGSTGDGYKFAESLGHTIAPPKPSLCGIILKSAIKWNNEEADFTKLPKLQGISLKNVTASIISANNEKKLFMKEFGEMLFTDKGVSGPIILTLSAYINKIPVDSYYLSIDLKPALTEKQLDDRILRDFSSNQNKMLKNVLKGLLPSGLIPFVIGLSDMTGDEYVNLITKENRKKIAFIIKNLRFNITSLEKIDSAIITSGGISVKEIDPKTMKSKLIDNLFFAGEVIDVDALTGGFNLQIAFSTGYTAGINLI